MSLQTELEKREAKRGFNATRRASFRARQLRIKATKHELRVKDLLSQRGTYYIFQKGFVKGGVCYIADFYIPKPWRLVIEVDGPSHFTEAGLEKDRIRDAYFVWRGFRVLHVTNDEVETMTSDALFERMCQAIGQSSMQIREYERKQGERRILKKANRKAKKPILIKNKAKYLELLRELVLS